MPVGMSSGVRGLMAKASGGVSKAALNIRR